MMTQFCKQRVAIFTIPPHHFWYGRYKKVPRLSPTGSMKMNHHHCVHEAQDPSMRAHRHTLTYTPKTLIKTCDTIENRGIPWTNKFPNPLTGCCVVVNQAWSETWFTSKSAGDIVARACESAHPHRAPSPTLKNTHRETFAHWRSFPPPTPSHTPIASVTKWPQ